MCLYAAWSALGQLVTQSLLFLVQQKFRQKYECPEKFVMLFIVNAIDFTSKHVVYRARDVTQCFATIDDVSREMRLQDGDRCCWEIDLGQTPLLNNFLDSKDSESVMRILRGGGAGKNLESTENLIHLIFALFIVDI